MTREDAKAGARQARGDQDQEQVEDPSDPPSAAAELDLSDLIDASGEPIVTSKYEMGEDGEIEWSDRVDVTSSGRKWRDLSADEAEALVADLLKGRRPGGL